MVPASAQLRVRPERKDGGHPALCNAPPQWLLIRHQSHQSQSPQTEVNRTRAQHTMWAPNLNSKALSHSRHHSRPPTPKSPTRHHRHLTRPCIAPNLRGPAAKRARNAAAATADKAQGDPPKPEI